jgi:hypothetical protein
MIAVPNTRIPLRCIRTAYRQAAQYCQHYDPHRGANLNGPARAKVEAIRDFVQDIEHGEQTPGP